MKESINYCQNITITIKTDWWPTGHQCTLLQLPKYCSYGFKIRWAPHTLDNKCKINSTKLIKSVHERGVGSIRHNHEIYQIDNCQRFLKHWCKKMPECPHTMTIANELHFAQPVLRHLGQEFKCTWLWIPLCSPLPHPSMSKKITHMGNHIKITHMGNHICDKHQLGEKFQQPLPVSVLYFRFIKISSSERKKKAKAHPWILYNMHTDLNQGHAYVHRVLPS